MSKKLELHWIGKDKEILVEPRILIENKELSNIENDENTENMLIHGDNLLALKNNLKEIRKEKGYSQTDLAELVGVSRNTISSIETGQFNPTAKLALILCIALDKKFEEIFYFD